ncbi:7-carboxy-7-deazaguanine synthase QueE [Alicyclobacillus ferrooxydans]|uniref:7-carboxy-7-deazaguanine synthase n=1 Tax=Alicyclobacillus ferrooxydans TaxID=471514 RepID=A0A0P9CZ10_9BACL|nr:7-carboxy-7-deazaguanine synthase QueE [Alicyclobacillus ferrooxydans]KPV42233.1 7-carboxy-7-deazaguanine synthase [Alicyclobacillus ferrooxydans]
MSKIPVLETFGPTIQGEGMVVGRKTMFVRTAGCDYQCVWCDSAYTWNGSEKHRTRMLSPEEVMDELVALGGNRFNHVTITGGNPALIGDPMRRFINLCHQQGHKVGLETQGSRMQDWFFDIDDLTLSPKPPSSKMETNWDTLDRIVHELTGHSVNFSLKIVVFDNEDVEYAKSVFARYPDVAQKYVQPGNAHTDASGNISAYLLERLEWLFGVVISDAAFNSVRVLPQLHAMVWSNERER